MMMLVKREIEEKKVDCELQKEKLQNKSEIK